jgi:hypothetical protein
MTAQGGQPATCGVAFKEWKGVCDALAEGRQSLILRKGGIAEGPGGFTPEHSACWLYPTHLHETEQGLRHDRPERRAAPLPDNTLEIQALTVVEVVGFVDRLDTLAALRDLHEWTDDTIRKRFEYRRPGLWVLGVRVFRGPSPRLLAVTPDHAGCRSWVPLEPPWNTEGLLPALEDREHARRMSQLRSVLVPGAHGHP